MCRQVIREFFPLNAPVVMLSSEYPKADADAPEVLSEALKHYGLVEGSEASSDSAGEAEWTKYIKIMTLEELLPMSFGPEQLEAAK